MSRPSSVRRTARTRPLTTRTTEPQLLPWAWMSSPAPKERMEAELASVPSDEAGNEANQGFVLSAASVGWLTGTRIWTAVEGLGREYMLADSFIGWAPLWLRTNFPYATAMPAKTPHRR